MIAKKYLIPLILIILISLSMAVPVIAAPVTYSVAVSSYGSSAISSPISPSKLSLINEYSIQKPVINAGSTSSVLSQGKTSVFTNLKSESSLPAIGTVSAFSKYSQKGNSTALDFSQSVSVSGSITTFEFSFSFM